MVNDDFLKSNPRKIIRCLSNILSSSELQKIDDEIKVNVKQLIRLGESHLRYTRSLSGLGVWRQKVSRSYYACYSLSKAIRLAHEGMYSVEANDHKKIGDLPDDFPDRDIWSNKMTKFRADRNISDYGHKAKERDLEYTSSQYLIEAENFIKEAKAYMKRKAYI